MSSSLRESGSYWLDITVAIILISTKITIHDNGRRNGNLQITFFLFIFALTHRNAVSSIIVCLNAGVLRISLDSHHLLVSPRDAEVSHRIGSSRRNVKTTAVENIVRKIGRQFRLNETGEKSSPRLFKALITHTYVRVVSQVH